MQLMSNTKKKTKKRSSWTVWSRGADDDDDEDAQSPGASSPVEAARHDAATTTTPQRRGLLRIFWDSAAAVAPLTTSFWGGGSKHQKRAWALCGTLLAVGLTQTWLLTKLSHWRSRVDTALQAKDPDGVEAIRGTAIFLYGRLTISWKEVLSGDLIAKYVATGLFVRPPRAARRRVRRVASQAAKAPGGVENPDERVTSTVDSLIGSARYRPRPPAEADLRAAPCAQQYAEEIVLFRGGDRELARCQRQLDGILGIQRSRRDWDAAAAGFMVIADNIANVASVAVSAGRVSDLLTLLAETKAEAHAASLRLRRSDLPLAGLERSYARDDHLTYPATGDDEDDYLDHDLASALLAVDLDHLQHDLATRDDWSARLSLGEQQRLSVARALLKRPALCVLDESTSALDVGTEARLYRLLRANVALVVSVAHRPTAMDFHTHVLECARLARDESNPAAALREWRFRALRAPVTRLPSSSNRRKSAGRRQARQWARARPRGAGPP
ncbi:ATP-binding cassette sub-family D [Aureococcus anophagefferens]|nr:ATP-binding cassette sub-family D [Aureococcus anophagefferens]